MACGKGERVKCGSQVGEVRLGGKAHLMHSNVRCPKGKKDQ